MTPDVNVLVAASRSDHPHHRVALDWLRDALAGAAAGAPFILMPMVVASMLRLVTSPRIFADPTPIADAAAFVDAILATPGARLGSLGPEGAAFRQRCVRDGLAGNALPDAWLAAAVAHQAEHLVSFDRDFRRLLPRGRLTLLAG